MAAPYTEQKDHVDFSKLGDTGQDNTDAIAPITNGEPATQNVLRRAPENLRERTEDVRQFAEETLYYRDTQHLAITSTGPITWGGTVADAGNGKITQPNAITIKPFLTPRADTKGTLSVGTVAVNQITYTASSTAWSTERMNQVFVEHRDSTGSALSVIITDGPVKRIIVVFDSANTAHDAATVKAAVDSAVAADTDLVGNLVVTTNAALLNAIAALTETRIEGTAEAESHRISAGVLDTLTTTTPLQSGDTVAIWYRYLVDPSGGFDGRRESTNTHGNVNIPIAALFITSVEPTKIPGAIPLCTVSGNTATTGTKLIWIDGSVFEKNDSFLLGGSSSSAVYYSGGPNWADATPNPANTVEGQLDKILTDLGTGLGGASKISSGTLLATLPGSDAIGAGNLAAQLQVLLDLVNDRADLTDTLLQTFAGPLSLNAATVADPKLGTAQYDDKYSQIWESLVKVPGPRRLRMYTAGNTAGTGRGLFITVNARWTTVWTADDIAFPAHATHIGDEGVKHLKKTTTTVAWADGSGWVSAVDDKASAMAAGQFVGVTADPEVPLLTAGDDLTGATHAGHYKLIFVNQNVTSPTQGKTRIYLYDNGLRTSLTITHNAEWKSGSSLWHADNNAKLASKFEFDVVDITNFGGLKLRNKLITILDWSDLIGPGWDNARSLSLTVYEDVSGQEGDFHHVSPVTRIKEIPLSSGFNGVNPPGAGFLYEIVVTGPNTGVLLSTAVSSGIIFPVDIPFSAVLTSVEALVMAPSSAITIAVSRNDVDYAGLSFLNTFIASDTTTTTATPELLTVPVGLTRTAGTSFFVLLSAGVIAAEIYGIRCTFQDYGFSGR